MQNPRAWTTSFHDTACEHGPLKLQCSRNYMLMNAHSHNQNNKFLVTTSLFSIEIYQVAEGTLLNERKISIQVYLEVAAIMLFTCILRTL